ncbi:hypothetical protein [Nocardia salmonicida]|uniref:hypothetical protein n=1 Tax=Nocardia salmonicida TaxID=53431 RepID=UPI0037B1F05E
MPDLSDALSDTVDTQQASTEGFAYALTVAAILVVLAAVLIATMLRNRSASIGTAVDWPTQ